MTGSTADVRRQRRAQPAARGILLVWVDAREAVLARWAAGRPVLDHVASDTPAHHRGTGHVRHDPRVRHGGGGESPSTVEGHRLEHERRFLDAVVERIEPDADVLVSGPGTLRDHLARRIRRKDAKARPGRAVASEAAGPMTDRQIVARLRRTVGEELPRQPIGRHAVRLGDAAPARRPVDVPSTSGRPGRSPRPDTRAGTTVSTPAATRRPR